MRAAWSEARWRRLLRVREDQPVYQRPIELGLAFIAVLGMQKMASGIGATASPIVNGGLVLLLLAHALVAVESLRPSRLSWEMTAATCLGIALVCTGELADPAVPTRWEADAWLGVPFAYLIVIRPRGAQLPLLTAVSAASLATMSVLSRVTTEDHLLPTVFLAASLTLLLLARRTVIALVEDQSASLAARGRDEAIDRSTVALTEALAAVRRTMHDSLLHCLQRISTHWRDATPADLREACALTRRALAEVPATSPPSAAPTLDAALREATAGEPCHIRWEGGAGPLPPLVLDAMAGATQEAVRNVVKHAGRPSARVASWDTASGARIEISDEGPGFDVDAEIRTRAGLRESVIGRLAQVGGAARIDSGPGGTTVTLEWPAPQPAPPPELGPGTRRSLAWVPAPLVAASVIQVWLHPLPSPLWALLVWLTLLAFLAGAVTALLRTGIGDAHAWVLCTVAAGAVALNFRWVDQAAADSWELWVPTMATALPILALPGRNKRTASWMGGFVVAATVVAGVWSLGPHDMLTTYFGGLMAILMNVLVTLVFTWGAADVAAHMHVTGELEAATLRRARDAVERDAVWREWLQRARELTDGFLADVAEGRRDPMSESTRREAGWLEARVRDELSLWPHPGAVTGELDRLRRLGWVVRTDLEDSGPDALAEAAVALRAMGAPVPGQSVTLVCRQGDLTMTFADPGLDEAQSAPLAGLIALRDPDFTLVRLKPAGPPAPGTQGGTT